MGSSSLTALHFLFLTALLLSKPSHSLVSSRAPRPSSGIPPLSAPAPTSGGDLPSFPSNGWLSTTPSSAPQASVPHVGAEPPSPAPTSQSPESGGIPFISSNPAVPIPAGETDSVTIRPLPTPGDSNQVVVGLGSCVGVGRAWLAFVIMGAALHSCL